MVHLLKLPLQFFGEGDPEPEGAPAPQPQVQTIPYARFQEVNARAQQAEAKVLELQKLLDESKGKDERIQALEKELNDTKAGYELEKKNAKRQSAIEAAIKDKVVDPEVVMKLLDLEKVVVDDDGKVTGLDDQLSALKASKSYLWKPAKPVVKTGDGGKGKNEKSFAQLLAEKKTAQQNVVSKSKTYF